MPEHQVVSVERRRRRGGARGKRRPDEDVDHTVLPRPGLATGHQYVSRASVPCFLTESMFRIAGTEDAAAVDPEPLLRSSRPVVRRSPVYVVIGASFGARWPSALVSRSRDGREHGSSSSVRTGANGFTPHMNRTSDL